MQVCLWRQSQINVRFLFLVWCAFLGGGGEGGGGGGGREGGGGEGGGGEGGIQGGGGGGGGDGAVVVTGGLGALGVVTAETLVEMGARCIVLASRSGKIKHDGQGLQERLDTLQASGARVVLEQCDTGDDQSVVGILERVRRESGPLRAVVHAAGVLSDGVFRTQDQDSMRRVVDPKAM